VGILQIFRKMLLFQINAVASSVNILSARIPWSNQTFGEMLSTKQSNIIQKTEGSTGIFQWNNISFFNSSNIFWESITQCKVMNPFQTFKNKIRQRVIDVNNAHKSFYL